MIDITSTTIFNKELIKYNGGKLEERNEIYHFNYVIDVKKSNKKTNICMQLRSHSYVR